MEISESGLLNDNPLDLIKLSYYMNGDKVYNEFKKVGIKVADENDLIVLANIVNKNVDTQGMLKDKNGNRIVFDTIRILNSIEWSVEEKEKAKQFKLAA